MTAKLFELARKWLGRRDGTTAVEFTLVAVPFMLMTIGIIEVALAYTASSLFQGATEAAARLVKTGQLQQSGGDPETVFRNALCQKAVVLVDCTKIQLEVVHVTNDSFLGAGTYAATFDEDGNLVSRGFDAGADNDVILIRAAYRYEFITPLLGQLLGGSQGSWLLLTTIVLETEPYDFDGPSGGA